jgi:hypothetical protein
MMFRGEVDYRLILGMLQAKPACLDGIRHERPHLSRVLRAAEPNQVCVPTV